MRIVQLLFTLIFVSCVTMQIALAEEGTAPPLQLAPGSGIQKGQAMANSQNVSPPMALQEEELRDIHGPLLLPEKQNYTMLGSGVLLSLVVLAVFVWFFWFRKKKIILPAADAIALAGLMRARSLISSGQPLQYANELSSILRRYIEARFHIPSTRKTTKEFFAGLTENPQQKSLFPQDHRERLKECLEECDMAKFARYLPDRSSMEKMESAVQYFVESTSTATGGEK